jgi:hypothetical protein
VARPFTPSRGVLGLRIPNGALVVASEGRTKRLLLGEIRAARPQLGGGIRAASS